MDWFKNPKFAIEKDTKKLKIPPSAFKKMTPSVKRYFEIKSLFWDFIIFYKVGKFYEMYDNDAIICNRELGLNFMKGEKRSHVGIPEKVYAKNAAILVERGYKVVRVDQVETVREMAIRKKKKIGPTVVKRDITKISTPGASGGLNDSKDSVYLLSIKEEETENKNSKIGICFVDSETSKVHFGEFEDDCHRTKLKTLLAAIEPGETVEESLSKETKNILSLKNAVRNRINNFECFENMFRTEKPKIILELENKKLAKKAFSNCFSYLNRLMVAEEILLEQKFYWYNPSNVSKRLILDGSTLKNLEIFENEEGGKQNTLFEWLNRCSTPFGHRLLKEWVARPLCNIQNINKRLDAIENLMELPELAEQISKKLNLLTDIEKMIIRIRAYSLQKRKIVFYENIDLKYLRIFVQIINSLKICCEIIYLFKRIKNKIFSKKLIELVFDLFPKECEEKLRISEKIDIEESEEKQKIVPKGQISEKFENIKEEMNLIKSKLEQHLNKYKKIFNDPSICFFEGFISNYQIEMKSETANQKLSEDLIEVSRTSKKRRFTTNEIKSLVEELEILQEKKNEYLESYLKTVLAEFCDHSKMWSAAIKSIAELDCILALYNVSAFSTGSMVRPFIVKNQEKPFLELKQSWHPQISFSEQTTSTTGFVPNDIFIGDGADTKAMIIVTGPNMGGKSTLLRQTCIAVILAQLGCFVPAKSAKLSLTDRIFTRIGANDAILANKSTFFVELEETSNILNNATENSLVILDELGRGTSTFDGAAIAFAVCEHLSKITKCRTLFSTHYHLLSKYYRKSNFVSQWNMAFEAIGSKLIFLYKFQKGICENSHGINCARMAGIDRKIIDRAEKLKNDYRNLLD